MRHALLLLCFALLIAACGPAPYVEVAPSYPGYPSYVYTYAGGGCWADDLWYGRCPWYAGPAYGYYWYGSGGFVHRPGYAWPYRPHAPPPSHWQPPRGRPSPPPVGRDHRRR